MADIGGKIGDVAVDGFNKVKDGISTAIDKIGDFGKSIGDAFGDLIGSKSLHQNTNVFHSRNYIKEYQKVLITSLSLMGYNSIAPFAFAERRLRDLARRAAEPGCSQFENDPSAACQFYLKPTYCQSCGFNPDKGEELSMNF